VTPDQARALLDRDPLKYFTPTPTQEAFLKRDNSIWASLIASVSRGGKSTISCVDLAYTLRGIHPYRPNYKPITIIQFTPSRLQAANVIGAKLFKRSELLLPNAPEGVADEPMIPKWEIEKLNEPNVAGMKVPYECIMKNGNRLLFSWAGVDGIAKRIAGLRLDGAYVDEDAGTVSLFDELYSRLLDAQSDKSKPGLGYFVWSNTNLTYNDAYESFIERARSAEPGHRVFEIGRTENPAIDLAARDRIRRVLSDDAASIRMDGELGAGRLTSIYAKQWYDPRHVLPAAYEISPADNLWVGYDPGVDHPMGMMVCAINKDQPLRLNVVKCWMYRGETIEKDVDNLAEWLRGRRITGFVYDTNLKNRDRGGGPSVLQRFKELARSRGIEPMFGYFQSKKNHAPGIALVRHYLAPGQEQTIEPLLVMSPATPDNGTGIFRQQMLKYRGKEATKFTGAGGVVKKDDELCDTIRYLIMQRPSYNKDWQCGRALDIATKRVDFLDKTGTIVVQPVPMDQQEHHQHDFMKGVFVTRSRDKRQRGSWQTVAI
jgi:hypothetical protein